jgi:hypothetical protein
MRFGVDYYRVNGLLIPCYHGAASFCLAMGLDFDTCENALQALPLTSVADHIGLYGHIACVPTHLVPGLHIRFLLVLESSAYCEC